MPTVNLGPCECCGGGGGGGGGCGSWETTESGSLDLDSINQRLAPAVGVGYVSNRALGIYRISSGPACNNSQFQISEITPSFSVGTPTVSTASAQGFAYEYLNFVNRLPSGNIDSQRDLWCRGVVSVPYQLTGATLNNGIEMPDASFTISFWVNFFVTCPNDPEIIATSVTTVSTSPSFNYSTTTGAYTCFAGWVNSYDSFDLQSGPATTSGGPFRIQAGWGFGSFFHPKTTDNFSISASINNLP